MIRKEDLGTYWGSVLRENAWHHSLPLPRRRCPLPPEQWGECDETSRIFCGHVNFPDMSEGDNCIWGDKVE